MREDDYLPMPKMTKAKSVSISNRTIDAYINFDLERMQTALAGQRFTVPADLPREEFEQWMKDMAAHINA